MGCYASMSRSAGQTRAPEYVRLCKIAKQKLVKINASGNTHSSFYLDNRKNIWKIHKNMQPRELKDLYLNNMRAFLLPKSEYILKPSSICKLGSTAFAIRMPKGTIDLFDFMHAEFDPTAIQDAFHQIAKAIHWLHDRRLAHRDIKPENILLHDGTWKMIDFDFCSPVEHLIHCGTECFFCGPDVTKLWPGPISDKSKRADVYAFGKCILMALWSAGEKGYMKQRRVIWVMFHKEYVPNIGIRIEEQWQPWLDIAMTCCAKVPPVEIPALPTTVVNTLRTIDTRTAVATVQMVDADVIFA